MHKTPLQSLRNVQGACLAPRLLTGIHAPSKNFVVGSGFEPLKAEPADLQSAPIGRSGNPPLVREVQG
jgi:hypothetical protein